MTHRPLFVPGLALLAGLAPVLAGAASFDDKDWELACDNTRTCRAAGYYRDADAHPVSVLLTRRAGRGTAVTGQLRLGTYEDDPSLPRRVALTIGGRAFGSIAIAQDEGRGALAAAQVGALVEALLHGGEILFSAGQQRWRLSDAGANAVLLRMDEEQGRVGTAGALVRKGAGGEAGVLPALAKPVVHAAALVAGPAAGEPLAQAVLASLQPPPEDCPDLQAPGEPPQIWRLAPHRVLVSARCWLAAYNMGYGFWVASDRPPYRPEAVTLEGSDFDAASSTLVAQQRGRGLGDCLSSAQWVWDGARFMRTELATTGQCRLVTAGGPWSLPTWVSEVVPAAGKRNTGEQRK